MHLLVKCSACGEDGEGETINNHLPVSGLTMAWEDFGYYGGFIDVYDDIGMPPQSLWVWCHDCVVKLLKTFPLLANMIPRGGHHCQDDTPCCNWAWRATEKFGKYEADERGELVPVSGAHYQFAENGAWVDKID